jgi:hypothetical protein
VAEGANVTVDPEDADRLAQIAREVGADVLEGGLSSPSETGSWQLCDVDLGEYLDRYRDKQVVLIIAPVGDAPAPTYTCGICGFVMNEPGACPRCCKVMAEDWEVEVRNRRLPGPDVLDQVRDLLDGGNGEGTA